jgi:hypothetical protein
LTADGERALDTRRLQRVRVNWLEATWDKVIVDNVDLLTDCLREADVIDESSTLRVLGTQVDNIDIVLAEVDSDERQALRRLVLVEDKLLRNSEAKRQVLAQIMDYAQTVQNDWPTSNLVEKLGIGGPGIADSRRWVEENEPELKRTMRRGDYLLVIAGDGIDEGMEKLARRFADRDDVVSAGRSLPAHPPCRERRSAESQRDDDRHHCSGCPGQRGARQCYAHRAKADRGCLENASAR